MSPVVVLGQRFRWGVGPLLVLLTGIIGIGAVVVAPPAVAGTAGPRALAVPASILDYVALGDSYSSGLGTGVYDPASGSCARSPLSYPPLWADEHHPASFRFVACSGARTTDVTAEQVPALQPGTDLVTITVGGNDAGFAVVLQTCTFAQRDSTCLAAVDAAEAYSRYVLPDRLARTYQAIRDSAPNARVIVLGYPRLFELPPSCADPLVPNQVRRQKLNEGATVLNDVIRSVSQRFKFSFVDVRGRFAGHGVCAPDPWINGPSVPSAVGPYHPNQTGYRQGYLSALDAETARSGIAA